MSVESLWLFDLFGDRGVSFSLPEGLQAWLWQVLCGWLWLATLPAFIWKDDLLAFVDRWAGAQ